MPMKIATAVVDLTPKSGIAMGGHHGAARYTRSTYGQLEANMVVLGEQGDTVVLFSIDTLFAGAAVTTSLIEACSRRFGIGPERVLVLASHTHFAPMLDPSKPCLGATDSGELNRWRDAMVDMILAAPTDTATSARSGTGFSDRAVNRRLRWRLPNLARLLRRLEGDIYLCDNPAGPRDRRIRTCVWLSDRDKPLAAFWSFACHPVAFPAAETASADFIGVVREALRARLGAGLPVIFAPGCMGDVRPRSPGPWLTLRKAARIAIYGPEAPAFDRESWDAWARGLSEEVVAIDANGDTRQIDSAPRAVPMVRLPMNEILEGTSPVPELHGKAIRLPGVGRVIALSCEPVTAIAGLVAESDDDLVLGYEGDVFGYLPTDAIVAEGGYEARRFMDTFGLRGAFRPGLDANIAAMGAALRP